jgi:NAD(P)-dependent dehydrogenase (short-subunit alcohol dehydrogenase family)
MLAAGWHVGLVARRADLLKELAGPYDGRAVALPLDVTDADAVQVAFHDFAEAAGRIDCLFNNAGIFTPAAPLDEIALEDWRRAVDVNLTGMFLCARMAFRLMRRQSPQGGRIIMNGSISAHVPARGAAPYTATKHAITGLTRQVALDGRPFDIACGQIDIGNAETDLLRGIAERARAEGQEPPPMMDVAHVADAVLAMAELPLEREHPVPDDHGDEDALCGPGLRLPIDPIHLSPNTAAGGASAARALDAPSGAHPLRYRNTAEASQPAAIAMVSDRMP